MFGADIEFYIEGNPVRLLSDWGFSPSTHSTVGIDGSYDVGEIRPLPSDTAKGLSDEICGIMRGLVGRATKDIYSGPGNIYPIGAHFHYTPAPPESFIHYMMLWTDKIIGLFTPRLVVNRKVLGYGREDGTVRWADHGGVEFRRLPSTLHSPRVVRFFCEYMYVAGYESANLSAPTRHILSLIPDWDYFSNLLQLGKHLRDYEPINEAWRKSI